MRRLLFSTLLILTLQGFTPLWAAKPGFTLWQLPPQSHTQMNSYVIRTDGGRVVVIDGGTERDTPYLRGFLAALGNRVEWWFVTHPHNDHMGALTHILNNPAGIEIGTVFYSPLTEKQMAVDPNHRIAAKVYLDALHDSAVGKVPLTEPGQVMKLDGLNLKVLQVNDGVTTVDAYNNSSMVLRLWDKRKSMLMLADTGEASGDRLLGSVPKQELDCDYIQMAHHGQMGVKRDFYDAVDFKGCLWPTPLWLWDNDAGQGYGTGPYKTLDTRSWIEQKGVTTHYCAWEGLVKIE